MEVGAGSGEILVQLRRFLPRAEMQGYDISSQAHAIAQPKERDGLIFHHGDFLAQEGPGATASCALACSTCLA
ncbi:MAG TPA: class I SAM-dependent methyltransferase [Sphingomonadaceae bacterium]|nr:class I SAM-dependent methyltransferase [Sphingomonadaceae bacterium]